MSSSFDDVSGTITIAIETTANGVAGWQLAFTSVVQIEPGVDARLVEQLASYHLVEPSEPVELSHGWGFTSVGLSHQPRHANDGPISAYLVAADGTTHELTVNPMTRSVAGDSTARTGERAAADDHDVNADVGDPDECADEAEAPFVPHPIDVHVVDGTASPHRTAALTDAPVPATAAWDAISALGERMTGRADLGAGGAISVTAVVDPGVPAEGYELDIAGDAVAVAASGVAGFRHAFVSLARWLPSGLPLAATVRDAPDHSWRGLHVDLARQWFEPDVVERLIDEAAWLKLSRFHLHLTDDEAWRLPVGGYEQLGEVAATRGHGMALPPMLGNGPAPTGRAYTEREIGRWVERADALGVVLVPEIDVPAHVHSALTALPELRDPGDTSGARSVQFYTDNVLVPGRSETDRFVEAVFTTVARLFPSSPWIHLGGDEVPDGAWSGSPTVRAMSGGDAPAPTRDIEARFHRNVVSVIRDRLGRSVGAWQEAAESTGVEPGDGYAIGWRTIEANRELARSGYDVVVSPGQAYYLDMAVDADWATPGASWAGPTSLDDVIGFDPIAGWSAGERERLLGIQACIWTEFVHDEAALWDRLFPRLDAIAERAWTGRIVGDAASLLRRAGRV